VAIAKRQCLAGPYRARRPAKGRNPRLASRGRDNGGQPPAVYPIKRSNTTSIGQHGILAILVSACLPAAREYNRGTDGLLSVDLNAGAQEDDSPHNHRGSSRSLLLASLWGFFMKVRSVVALSTIFLACLAAPAQQRKPLPADEMSKYVVSAKSGVINLIEGKVQVLRAKQPDASEAPKLNKELQYGDHVTTDANSRTEILLNPGCYLRLDEQSEVVFLFDGLDKSELKLLRGSAVLEASAIEAPISVETPKAKFEIERDGLYRFNVVDGGKADVSVRRGRLTAGSTPIKEGKRALVEGETAAIAKLNKKDIDSFDEWSKERAKSLIAANSRLSLVGVRRALGMSSLVNAWIYDPFCRCYTFLPFADGFASPYGLYYSVCNPFGYGYYYQPRHNNSGWVGNNGGNNGGGYGGGHSGGGTSGGGAGGGGGNHTPPPSMPPSRGATDGGAAGRAGARETPAPRRP
jgi:hypothetical protein